jgi:hypothetical protein
MWQPIYSWQDKSACADDEWTNCLGVATSKVPPRLSIWRRLKRRLKKLFLICVGIGAGLGICVIATVAVRQLQLALARRSRKRNIGLLRQSTRARQLTRKPQLGASYSACSRHVGLIPNLQGQRVCLLGAASCAGKKINIARSLRLHRGKGSAIGGGG